MSALQRDYDLGMLLMVQRMTSALPTIETTNERGRRLFEGWIDRLNARIEHIDPDALLPPRLENTSIPTTAANNANPNNSPRLIGSLLIVTRLSES